MTQEISIHAPHARSDLPRKGGEFGKCSISIHAPHARSDENSAILSESSLTFQSTLLMRGATAWDDSGMTLSEFQSTLLMRGATWPYGPLGPSTNFNPRSSCEERRVLFGHHGDHKKFQSTLLMRGATCGQRRHCSGRRHFNPRSSCEERQQPSAISSRPSLFQSTLLMRGATG